MTAIWYVLYFLAGVATLLIGIPQFADQNKLNEDKVPGFVYGLSRPFLILLNVLALLPATVVVGTQGVFSLPTLAAIAGMMFGALPVLMYLMAPLAEPEPANRA